jgi:hypothetical protein
MRLSRAVAVSLAAGVAAQTEEVKTCKATANYPGWQGIKYAFVL